MNIPVKRAHLLFFSNHSNMKVFEGSLFSQFIHSECALAGKSKKHTHTHAVLVEPNPTGSQTPGKCVSDELHA